MAEGKSLTTREAVEGVLGVERADVLRESVAVMVREMMEAEVAQLAGAELGERAPGIYPNDQVVIRLAGMLLVEQR